LHDRLIAFHQSRGDLLAVGFDEGRQELGAVGEGKNADIIAERDAVLKYIDSLQRADAVIPRRMRDK